MPAGAKRKGGAQNGGPTSKKVKPSKEDEDQYYQGLSVSEFPGLEGGTCLLRSPGLTFQSPLDGVMRFEVISSSEGPGTGGIRLFVPSGGTADVVDSPVFMVPFEFVEQVIILDEPGQKNSTPVKEKAHRVIVVPTAAVGASALRRTYPKIISFTLPNKKASSDFSEEIGEAVHDSEETYRGLVTRVFNEQLAPYLASVIDVSSAAKKSESKLVCDAVFKQESDSSTKPVKGKLFFLRTGILFHSQTTILYLTAESTPTNMLVSNYEPSSKRAGPVNLTLVCPTLEPYYEQAPKSQKRTSTQRKSDEPLFISFHNMAVDTYDRIVEYAELYDIELNEVEQDWYNLKNNEPMTSWMPRGMMPRNQ